MLFNCFKYSKYFGCFLFFFIVKVEAADSTTTQDMDETICYDSDDSGPIFVYDTSGESDTDTELNWSIVMLKIKSLFYNSKINLKWLENNLSLDKFYGISEKIFVCFLVYTISWN